MGDQRALDFLGSGTDPSALDSTLDGLARWPRLALDTEADSFHRYFEKVCLIQLSVPDRDFLIDPLGLRGVPDSLRRILCDPARTVVLHGADYDVLLIRRDFELVIGRLFDTMLAARFLGLPTLGLQALLESELGIRIKKDSQRSDWARRPLSAEQVSYARQDTMHLLPLAERLEERLRERGRLAWVQEECELLRQRVPAVKTFDPEAWRKISGSNRLPDRGQRALRAAFLWRDEQAKKRDKAPFRVLANELLLVLAIEVGREGLPAVDGFAQEKRQRGMDLRGLPAAIRIGLEVPVPEPVREERRPVSLDAASKALLQKLKAARDLWAEQLALEPGVVAPGALLESLARSTPRELDLLAQVPGMTAWRLEAIGTRLLDLLR